MNLFGMLSTIKNYLYMNLESYNDDIKVKILIKYKISINPVLLTTIY